MMYVSARGRGVRCVIAGVTIGGVVGASSRIILVSLSRGAALQARCLRYRSHIVPSTTLGNDAFSLRGMALMRSRGPESEWW